MGLRLQAIAIAVMLVGSCGTLLFNVFSGRVPAGLERSMREQLRSASREMAARAQSIEQPAATSNGAFDQLNHQLSAITAQVLAGHPGIEGGFYLGGGMGRFAGYAFPTHRHPGKDAQQTDPPPLEAPYIRLQAQESLTIEPGEVRVSVRDVEASRVVMLTEPVGNTRPAVWTTWLMYRLVDPKQLGTQMRRYQASSGLAMAGMVISLVLLVNLGRSLQRQRAEQSLLRENLRRSEHLAALGKLLAGVAHEVRNPLAAIRSTVQLWQRLPESRTPASLEAVVRSVDRLNDSVSQLLQFSRVDHAERSPLDVNALLREALDLLHAQLMTQHVACDEQLDQSAPCVLGSANALRQVFGNLLQNALQAIPDGGNLQVRTHHDQDDQQLEITISDSGPGVPRQDQPHLFEPFFTTRPEGTGLGLALCREIVAQHGGQIEYVDGALSGATFRIRLPTTAISQT